MGTQWPDELERQLGEGERIYPPPPRTDVAPEAPQTEADRREATDRVTRMIVTSGSAFELFAGMVGIVLAIVALAGYFALPLAALATIAVGIALLAQGSTIAARWREATRIVDRERADVLGMTTEMFGGLATIVLGGLALAGVASLTLLAAAALVLGAALLLGGPAQPDLAEVAPAPTHRHWEVTRSIVRSSSGVMVMGGVAAVVLGVLAIAGVGPALALALTALLCVAAALMLAGGSLYARFAQRLS